MSEELRLTKYFNEFGWPSEKQENRLRKLLAQARREEREATLEEVQKEAEAVFAYQAGTEFVRVEYLEQLLNFIDTLRNRTKEA